MDKLKDLNRIEELVIRNTLMLKVLRAYCLYDINKNEETASILIGLEYMLEQQQKITKLLENTYKHQIEIKP
ncbi:MAG: hypothetical protein BHW62_00875 [Acinetobacter sp. CAG:196_36_41]|jgi:hypothetical protein|nr:MAG: hypothetical protein BHW62_00875 [Acinetobacter sp. CAG:196_36_41]